MSRIGIFWTLVFIFVVAYCVSTTDEKPEIDPQKATQAQIWKINQGLGTLNSEDAIIDTAAAIRMKEDTTVYFVAAQLNRGYVGIWAIYGGKDAGGLIVSMNPTAKKYTPFTDSPHVSLTKRAQMLIDTVGRL